MRQLQYSAYVSSERPGSTFSVTGTKDYAENANTENILPFGSILCGDNYQNR